MRTSASTPNSAPRSARCAISAALTRALVGMHPTLIQVPPSASGSTSSTRAPRRRERIVVEMPPIPPPTTTRSGANSFASIGDSLRNDGPLRARQLPRRHRLAGPVPAARLEGLLGAVRRVLDLQPQLRGVARTVRRRPAGGARERPAGDRRRAAARPVLRARPAELGAPRRAQPVLVGRELDVLQLPVHDLVRLPPVGVLPVQPRLLLRPQRDP